MGTSENLPEMKFSLTGIQIHDTVCAVDSDYGYDDLPRLDSVGSLEGTAVAAVGSLLGGGIIVSGESRRDATMKTGVSFSLLLWAFGKPLMNSFEDSCAVFLKVTGRTPALVKGL